MKLFVYEHISGGGLVGERISSSILSEGYAMLKTLVSDFKAAGHIVITLLDSRLMAFNPPIEVDDIILISSWEELENTFKRLSRSVDAVYIIAPESNQKLQKLVEMVEIAGGSPLNSPVDAIWRASNKMVFYETMKKTGLPVPETVMIDLRENSNEIRHFVKGLGFPLVFKPVDGVGCCGLSVVRDTNQIAGAVNKIKKETPSRFSIIQPFIEGIAASVSLISTGKDVLPLTLNKQIVSLAPPSSNSGYCGGIVPLRHPLEEEALRVARVAVESLKGLMGYIGVDMVLTHEGPVVMEVNPRLTTSYTGLRRVVNFNPAQAMIDAVLRRKLPENVRSSGYSFFSKVEVFPPAYGGLRETYELKGVVSPPFPFAGDRWAYALIAAHSNTLKEAKIGFYKTRRRLLDVLSRRE